MKNTVTMETPTEETPHYYIRLIDSLTPWQIGKPCLTAEALIPPGGYELEVGRIIFDYDRDAKRPMYRAQNVDGTPLFEPTYSLPELKQQFNAHSGQLVAYAKAHGEHKELDPLLREPVPSPYAEERTAERGKKISKSRSKGRATSKSRGK